MSFTFHISFLHKHSYFGYQEKRQQLLTEIRMLCEAPCYEGLVEFHGAFYTPDSGQISIALEYMDGGSLADVIRVQQCIPEPVLSSMVRQLLHVRCILWFSRFLLSWYMKMLCFYSCNLKYFCICLQGTMLLAWSSTFSS